MLSLLTFTALVQRFAASAQSAAALLFGLHYLLLGAITAAAMNAAGVIQGVSAATLSSRRWRVGVFPPPSRTAS